MALARAVLVLLLIGSASRQNHEHPTEHPSERGKDTGVTKEQRADVFEIYIEE